MKRLLLTILPVFILCFLAISYVPTSWPTLSADVQKAELFDFAIGGITITDVRVMVNPGDEIKWKAQEPS